LTSVDLVLLVGLHAQRWYLGDAIGPTLTQTVRTGPKPLTSMQGALGVPLPHPSWRNTGWLKANPWFATEILPALQAAVDERI
jgi:uracil-DNA glycosylase